MNIIINYTSGGVSESCGMADHIDFDDHLALMGFETFPDVPIPDGDYGRCAEIMCVRRIGWEYDADEYDVAQCD